MDFITSKFADFRKIFESFAPAVSKVEEELKLENGQSQYAAQFQGYHCIRAQQLKARLCI